MQAMYLHGRWIAIVALVAAPVGLASTSFRGSAQVGKPEVTATLFEELADSRYHLGTFEASLNSTFTALPKNEHGNLGHQAARYALLRYFMKQHGWYIKGLEPGKADYSPPPQARIADYFVKEWIPGVLQDALEHRAGKFGLDLHDLAALAATYEDLIRKEVRTKLELAYTLEGLPGQDDMDRTDALHILETYLVQFVYASDFTVPDNEGVAVARERKSRRYRNYASVHDFYEDILDRHLGSESTAPLARVSFNETVDVAYDLGQEFHTFNEKDCVDLRKTLERAESRKAGRVRLSTFYNMTRYTHFRFGESVDYLRALGALDETDSKVPSVIISNYVLSRPNCLEASNLYVVCCRNACEDLMAHLESSISRASAAPALIADIVSKFKSNSDAEPLELSAALLGRLDEVAAHHDGEVPIHGRLFAQWMHHVFPLECPYPNIAAASLETPGASFHEQASEEEMRQHIEDDVCAVNWEGRIECAHEVLDLPWSMTEEMISSDLSGPPYHGINTDAGMQEHQQLDQTGRSKIVMILGIAALCVAVLGAGARTQRLRYPGKNLLIALGFSLLVALRCVGMLHGFASVCVLLSGLVACIEMASKAKHMCSPTKLTV